MSKILYAGLTDIGRKRGNNEDNFGYNENDNIIVVCDGMGGHLAGEVASGIAVKTVLDMFGRDIKDYIDLIDGINTEISISVKKLCAGIRGANRMIYNEAIYNPNKKGMGTTVVAGAFFDNAVGIAHVGDSRAYLWRDGKLNRITKDHSYVQELIEDNEITEEEAENFSQKNVITRALGTKYSVKIDIQIQPIQEGDIYLFCTDGLTGELRDNEIEEIITRFYPDIGSISRNLIDAANNAGGNDNITVGLAYVKEVEPSKRGIKSRFVEIPEETEEFLEKEDEILKRLYTIKKPPWYKLPAGRFGGVGLIVILGIVGGLMIHRRSSIPHIDSVWVKLITEPDSCEVIWNGKEKGKTPLLIPNLKPDSTYSFRLERRGYKPTKVSLIIPSPEALQGETLVRQYHIDEEAGLIAGYDGSKYDNYELILDGKNIGVLKNFNNKLFPLSKGQHKVEVRNGSETILKRDVVVPEDKELFINLYKHTIYVTGRNL